MAVASCGGARAVAGRSGRRTLHHGGKTLEDALLPSPVVRIVETCIQGEDGSTRPGLSEPTGELPLFSNQLPPQISLSPVLMTAPSILPFPGREHIGSVRIITIGWDLQVTT